MTKEKNRKIQDATKSGIRPRQILNVFRQEDASCILQLADIYNKKTKLLAAELKNLMLKQALTLILRERTHWLYALEKNPVTHQITRLFIAYLPTSFELLTANYELFILDYTYKTNRYKMPLLDIVGQTCLGTKFTVGICFLSSGTQEDYEWALTQGLKKLYQTARVTSPDIWVTDRDLALIKAIERLYPQASVLLCNWHINMDIRAYASKILPRKQLVDDLLEDWKSVIYSHTVDDYIEN